MILLGFCQMPWVFLLEMTRYQLERAAASDFTGKFEDVYFFRESSVFLPCIFTPIIRLDV
jgi:hypothetical protein